MTNAGWRIWVAGLKGALSNDFFRWRPVNRLFDVFYPASILRFLRSLNSTPAEERPADPPQQSRGDAPLQLVAVGGHDEAQGSKEELRVDFSMESILQFQNEHLIHKTVSAPPAAPVRKRPNYDNRKRRFLAAQAPERKRLLVGSLKQNLLIDPKLHSCP